MHIATASRLMGLGMGADVGVVVGEGPDEGSGEGSSEQSIMKPMICADFDTGEAVQCTVDEMGRTLVSNAIATAAANAAANANSKLPPKAGKQDITTIALFAVAAFSIFKLVRG